MALADYGRLLYMLILNKIYPSMSKALCLQRVHNTLTSTVHFQKITVRKG